MDQDITKIIKDRFAQLPQELRDAITATDLPIKMKTISNTHGLLIDQLEGLQNEILFVLLGLEPSSDFVDNLSRELEIPREKAFTIAQDTNKLIFDSIREHIQKWEEKMQIEDMKEREMEMQEAKTKEQRDTAVSSLEKIGGFSIEKDEGNIDDENTIPRKETLESLTSSDKDAMIQSIENPSPANAVSHNKINVLESTDTHVDPIIDHLLTTAVSMPQQTVKTTMTEVPKKIPVPQKSSVADRYREPVQ